jgi:type I restriction enzyme S subunit
MNLTPIRDLVKKTHHLDPKKLGQDSFTYVDISSVDKDTKRITEPQTLLVGDAPSRARKEIKENDVLVATVRPNLNGVAIVPSQYDNQIASTGFCVLRSDTEQLDPNYLFYFTQTDYFISHLTELSTGAGYPAVSDEDILDARIPLPPLTEQKRIASLLARADRLRQLRRTAHDLGDALLQSVFLEMFGDPIENTNHWEMVELSDVAKKITDGEHLTPKTLPTGLPIVMAQQVEASGVNLDNCKFVSEEDFKKFTRKCKPEFGDLLLVSRGATIGRSCVVNTHEPFCLMGSVILIKPDGQKINPKFLGQIFKNSKFQDYIRETSNASAQQAIYVAPVAERKIILPPLSLQEEFAGVVARVESLRGRMGESTRQVEGLFESLLAEAFS